MSALRLRGPKSNQFRPPPPLEWTSVEIYIRKSLKKILNRLMYSIAELRQVGIFFPIQFPSLGIFSNMNRKVGEYEKFVFVFVSSLCTNLLLTEKFFKSESNCHYLHLQAQLFFENRFVTIYLRHTCIILHTYYILS